MKEKIKNEETVQTDKKESSVKEKDTESMTSWKPVRKDISEEGTVNGLWHRFWKS